MVLSETGKPAEALAAYEQARAIRERLARENPTVTEFQHDLAKSHNNIGVLLSATGKPAEALAAYEQARAIEERLARENPTVTQFQSDLAGSHNNIGMVLSDIGKPAEAIAAYEQARAIFERLARENPTVTEFQSDLAASHNNIGVLFSDTGKPAEALASYEQARAIWERLARDNPTVTQFQRDLAGSHNNIGMLLSETGKPAEAMAAYEQARAVCQRLARENPTVTEFQSELAVSYHNIGQLLSEAGKPAEALVFNEKARAIRERLARENPIVGQFQSHLAESHNNIGTLLRATGKPTEALVAYEKARAIRERLARDNPTVTYFQRDLAASHHNIGTLLLDTGKPAEALAAYEKGRAIQERLVRKHPESPDDASHLGVTLNNMAGIESRAERFVEARDRLREAILWQKKALAANPEHRNYRQSVRNHYAGLLSTAGSLRDPALAAEAEQGLAELAASDPMLKALDARLAAVLGGTDPKGNAERLQLAYHGYNRKRYAASARLFAEALECEPVLADDREEQHAYNAACAAALAASVKTAIAQPSVVQVASTSASSPHAGASQTEGAEKPLTDIQRLKLRNQACSWLKAELDRWDRLLKSANEQQRAVVKGMLEHWLEDPELVSVRDAAALDRLPDVEQHQWRRLWDDVRRLLDRAATGSVSRGGPAMPNGADASAQSEGEPIAGKPSRCRVWLA